MVFTAFRKIFIPVVILRRSSSTAPFCSCTKRCHLKLEGSAVFPQTPWIFSKSSVTLERVCQFTFKNTVSWRKHFAKPSNMSAKKRRPSEKLIKMVLSPCRCSVLCMHKHRAKRRSKKLKGTGLCKTRNAAECKATFTQKQL